MHHSTCCGRGTDALSMLTEHLIMGTTSRDFVSQEPPRRPLATCRPSSSTSQKAASTTSSPRRRRPVHRSADFRRFALGLRASGRRRRAAARRAPMGVRERQAWSPSALLSVSAASVSGYIETVIGVAPRPRCSNGDRINTCICQIGSAKRSRRLVAVASINKIGMVADHRIRVRPPALRRRRYIPRHRNSISPGAQAACRDQGPISSGMATLMRAMNVSPRLGPRPRRGRARPAPRVAAMIVHASSCPSSPTPSALRALAVYCSIRRGLLAQSARGDRALGDLFGPAEDAHQRFIIAIDQLVT